MHAPADILTRQRGVEDCYRMWTSTAQKIIKKLRWIDLDLLFPPISTIKLPSEYFPRYIKSELFALSLCTPSDESRVDRYTDVTSYLNNITPSCNSSHVSFHFVATTGNSLKLNQYEIYCLCLISLI